MITKEERFTIWTKSLLFHGNGCTVFDSDGEIVYRVDNYDEKRSNEVYLMDLKGSVLFSIHRKKVSFLGHWNGYIWRDTKVSNDMPFFQVTRKCNFLGRSTNCHVSLGCDKAKQSCYIIVELAGKSSFNIIDSKQRTIAESFLGHYIRDHDINAEVFFITVRPKQSFSGVLFGDDVLSLVVEPQTDHSFVMALVVVYGLIKHKI